MIMSKTRILLVDDEELIRLSLEINLRREGFEIRSVTSGEEALALLPEYPCDLLLTDYFMEGMTGTNLLKEVKKLYPQIRVMIFSGYEKKDTAAEMLHLGADDFICKPLEFEELLKRIAAVFANQM